MFSIPFNYITGIGVPVLLALMGVVGKKLVRNSPGWRRHDFYLGSEFTLAAVSAALLNIFGLLSPNRTGSVDTKILLSNFIIAFTGVFLFMFVLSLHKDWESNNGAEKSIKKELFWLLGVCNVIGFGLLVAGIILIPGA